MTVVVSTMILNSLIANGEKTIGGSLTTAEQTYYLGKLNAMVESWSLDRRMCYSVKQENFSLTASTGTYTIGVGGTFNTARPTKILNAFIRDSANADSGVTSFPMTPSTASWSRASPAPIRAGCTTTKATTPRARDDQALPAAAGEPHALHRLGDAVAELRLGDDGAAHAARLPAGDRVELRHRDLAGAEERSAGARQDRA
jgi:hypothetical protein